MLAKFTCAFLEHPYVVTPRAYLRARSAFDKCVRRAGQRSRPQKEEKCQTDLTGPFKKGFHMPKRSLRHLLELSVLSTAALLALSARADLQERKDHRQE